MTEMVSDVQKYVPVPPEIPAPELLALADPELVLALSAVLTAADFPYSKENHPKANCRNWSREDYVYYGQLLFHIIAVGAEAPPRFSREHIDRAYRLGLGPSKWCVNEHFGHLWQLREAIGAPILHSRQRFREWSISDYRTYAQQLAKELKHKPTGPDYEQSFSQDQGPSIASIKERLGGIGALNELIGYPDIRSWAEEDYVEWAIKATAANEAKLITVPIIRGLTALQRGPDDRTIRRHFGSIKKFQNIVNQERIIREAARQEAMRAKLDKYRAIIDSGKLPASFAELNDDELLPVAGRYLLVTEFARSLKPERKIEIAMQPSGRLIPSLLKYKEHLEAAVIEITAETLGVFDDVWPMDGYLTDLKLPERA